MTLLERSLDTLGVLWFPMIIGTVFLVLATSVGWVVGGFTQFAPVRMVSWWLSRVVLPLLDSPSWPLRSAVIFVNNSTVLVVLLVLGTWKLASQFGVVVLGLNLGIALRCLARSAELFAPSSDGSIERASWVGGLGMALNLLEIPAIVIVLGLSLGIGTVPLEFTRAWEVFLVAVVPALFIAAGGEGLWLGLRVRRDPPRESDGLDGHDNDTWA